MKRNILIGVFFLLFSFVLSGCNNKTSLTTSAEEAVKGYIAAASSQNWRQAAEYLTGEALASAEQNVKREYGKPTTVIDEKLKTISQTEGFALVIADITEIPEHNRWNYRFYLERKEGNWRIYKMETAPPELPAKLVYSEIPEVLKDTLKAYVSSAVRGDWSEAQKYLTGQALIQARRQNIKDVKLQGSVSNFQLTPVGMGGGYFLIRGSYAVSYPSQQQVNVEVMFTVVDAAGMWKINQVDRL